jgi:Na+-transporting methylmalonyl-CoA/oxaloacetate decarboxylase gamma subunit
MATSRYEDWIMNKSTLLCLIILLLAAFIGAENPETGEATTPISPQPEVIADSLMQVMGKLVQQEYGFLDTDKLADVAIALDIRETAEWKTYLGLESQNPTLDKKSLRDLGITPYRAFLGKQFCLHGFTEQSTVAEIASRESIPVKKLRQLLNIPTLDRGRDGFSLQALAVPIADVDSMISRFKEEELPYGFSLMGAGMLIVFSALLITSIVISQLIHLNRNSRKKDPKLIITHAGKLVSAGKEISNNTIAAAITALFLYKQGIEDRRRLLLTFHRTPTNQWRASGVLDMPNRVILRNRRPS